MIFQSFGYDATHTFVDAAEFATITGLLRIPLSLAALPVFKICRKRPLYLFVSAFLFVFISGIFAFAFMVETGYLTEEEIWNSLG